jgi:hypothetical protein
MTGIRIRACTLQIANPSGRGLHLCGRDCKLNFYGNLRHYLFWGGADRIGLRD